MDWVPEVDRLLVLDREAVHCERGRAVLLRAESEATGPIATAVRSSCVHVAREVLPHVQIKQHADRIESPEGEPDSGFRYERPPSATSLRSSWGEH